MSSNSDFATQQTLKPADGAAHADGDVPAILPPPEVLERLGAHTYGEVDARGFADILAVVRPREGEVFVDIGSGTGKVRRSPVPTQILPRWAAGRVPTHRRAPHAMHSCELDRLKREVWLHNAARAGDREALAGWCVFGATRACQGRTPPQKQCTLPKRFGQTRSRAGGDAGGGAVPAIAGLRH